MANMALLLSFCSCEYNLTSVKLRKDTLSFDLRYLVNYVRYQKSVWKIEFSNIDYPQIKFEEIISKDVGGDRFEVKTQAS